MAPQQAPYPLRIEPILTKKIKTLAKQNKRSYNKELEYILESYIREYETQHGEIPCFEE